MKQYTQYIGSTDGVHHLTAANGNTKDIMNTVMLADGKAGAYCAKLAQALTGADQVQTCYNIWKFWKQNVKYVEDPDGQQFIKSPAYLYEVGEGDCKSYSVAIASCLKHLGIPYAYRFITQEAGKPFHHVYIVAHTNKGTVLIDCVIDYFNKENAYERKRDVSPTNQQPPMPKAAIGRASRGVHYLPNSIGKLDVSTTTVTINNNRIDVGPPNPRGYWTDIIEDYNKNYQKKRTKLIEQILADFKNAWLPAKPLRFSLFLDKFRKNYDVFFDMAFAMSYHFWNETNGPLPIELAAKRAYGRELHNNLVQFGLRSGTLQAMCDLSCYKMYGVPLDYMIYRAQCITKYGQPWEPVAGIPYWNAKTGTLENNGAPTLDMAFQLVSCMPYTNATGETKVIALPNGQPYWSVGGWVMRNGATESYLNSWLEKNPTRPPGTYYNTTKENIDKAILTYQKWLNGNLAGLPSILILGGRNDNKISVSGSKSKVGYLPIGEIVAIVTAVVTALGIVSGIVAKIVEAVKLKKANNSDIPEFKQDFKELYQTVDGCIMYQNTTTGRFRKCCPDGQCQENANPNDPANRAGAGNFGGGGSSSWLWIAAAALLGVWFLSGSSKSNS